jgi:hypothetical protein
MVVLEWPHLGGRVLLSGVSAGDSYVEVAY